MIPKAAFILRVYNTQEKLIRKAIESIVNQTEKNWVLLIRDNGCTDCTTDILKEYATIDDRICYYRNEVNNQFTEEEARIRADLHNYFMVTLGCEYFAFLDSDDAYAPDFLERTYDLATQSKSDIVCTGHNIIEEKNESIVSSRLWKYEVSNQEFIEGSFEDFYGSMRVLWGKLYANKLWIPFWDIMNNRPRNLMSGSDTYTLLKLTKISMSISCIDKPMYDYLVRSNSVYRGDIDKSRIEEGEILFEAGSEAASNLNSLTNQTVTFLCNVYWYHIQDLLEFIKRTDTMLNRHKAEFVRNIMNALTFKVIMQKNFEFALCIIETLMHLDIKDKDLLTYEVNSEDENKFEKMLDLFDRHDYKQADYISNDLFNKFPVNPEILCYKIILSDELKNNNIKIALLKLAGKYCGEDENIIELLNEWKEELDETIN